MLVIAVRTLAVLSLVVGLPLLALPPVSARVSGWIEEVTEQRRLDFRLADFSIGKRQPRTAESRDETGVRWQADGLAANSHGSGDRLDLAMDAAQFPEANFAPQGPAERRR